MHVCQGIHLGDGFLRLRLAVHATEDAMPASCGWHPWFRRVIADTPLRLDFSPGFMLSRDEAGIATRERIDVPEGPWDDCFGEISSPPSINWPGFLNLTMISDCDWWVVCDERDYAVCVEPQTAPPDALNITPTIVRPGNPLVANLRFQWTTPEMRKHD